MKAKRIVILTLVFSLIFGASIYADSIWGTFDNNFPIAKVEVNDSEIAIADWEVPAVVMKGTTVLPLRKVADALQAMVKWDDTNKTAKIYKPNVHMFIARSVTKQSNDEYVVKSPFGKVNKGDTMKFAVFAQVDNLKTNVTGFKISIISPDGELATESKEVPLESLTDSFWYPWPFEVYFSQRGDYRVTFSFKDEKEVYHIVSEKMIVSE